MAWRYFACIGAGIDPVEESASWKPDVTLEWVEREMRNAQRMVEPWQCRVFRVSVDMKCEAVARYTKPMGRNAQVDIVYHATSL